MAQKRQTYHHKDLRNALIETGIQIVSTEGVNAFSLRKVAAVCGVSHAAPYSHFQNKEELLEAMQLFITDRFSKQLESAVQKNNNVAEILKDMGIVYVSFFAQVRKKRTIEKKPSYGRIEINLPKEDFFMSREYRHIEQYREEITGLQ